MSLDVYLMIAYIGGAFPYLVGRVEHGFNVRPDLCATENPFTPRYVYMCIINI